MEINRITKVEQERIEEFVKGLQVERNKDYDGVSDRMEDIQIKKYNMAEKHQWDRIEKKLDTIIEVLTKAGLQEELDKLGIKEIKI
jgi:hypothetical protein